jgi:hypothetical protein
MFLIPSAQIAVILFGGLLLGNRDNILYLYSWLGIGEGFHGPTERLTSNRSVVFTTNKTYRHDIIEIVLKVALSTFTLTL